MTPEVAFLAGAAVAAAIILSRWSAEERQRVAELETIVQLIQQLTRLTEGTTDEHSGKSAGH